MLIWTLLLYLPSTALAVRSFSDRVLAVARELQSRAAHVSTPDSNVQYARRDDQRPLLPYQDVSAISTHHSARLELESALFWGLIPFYWTNIALGTPNQAFRMIVSMSYGGALVRAPNCTGGLEPGCGGGFMYYHNQSTTYRDEHEKYLLHLPGQFIYGYVSTDHMQLVGLNITNVTFGEVDDFHGEDFLLLTMEHIADGAIGLMPPRASMPLYTDTELPNILSKIKSEEVLDKNIMVFDLKPPPEKGSLYLGAVPVEAVGNPQIRIPLSTSSPSPFEDMWHANIDEITTSGEKSIILPLNHTHAGFELGTMLQVPPWSFEAILDSLGADQDNALLPTFNCSRWDDMPDMVFTLAGQEVTISVEDYSLRFYDGPYLSCAVQIFPTSDWVSDGAVVVGLEMFRRKYYVGFDMDTNEMLLIERER